MFAERGGGGSVCACKISGVELSDSYGSKDLGCTLGDYDTKMLPLDYPHFEGRIFL
jgi:hypothetical protein